MCRVPAWTGARKLALKDSLALRIEPFMHVSPNEQ